MKLHTLPNHSHVRRFALGLALALGASMLASPVHAAPKSVVISLDGMTPRFVNEYLQDGTLSPNSGIGRLIAHGLTGLENTTVSPSLTAPGHIAIATGSIGARNDIAANTFKLVASPFFSTISGFNAPIGGYSLEGGMPHESEFMTAAPVWILLREAGKKVVTATFPGGDGIDVRVPGVPGSPIIQPAAERTVDFTVPFGAAAPPFQKGFTLDAASFAAAPVTEAALVAVGHASFSPVLQANLETFTSGGVVYDIKTAALDTTNDSATNYDTIVLFNQVQGIQSGAFSLPSTGPAYIKPNEKISALFYLEGHSIKAGVRYFVTALAPNLSTVRLARTSTSFIPRNAPVLGDVDEINNTVGFWQPQPDFRIVEKLDAVPSSFASFPDLELEAIYEELVREFADYQARVAIRAIENQPNADLVMTYIEQPDGSFHQFLLVDPRQPTNFLDQNSIGAGQDLAKIARYQGYLRAAYQAADRAVEKIIQASGGVDAQGKPKANIFVVSDHGFLAFHTAVNLPNLLTQAGFATSKVRAATSGPAANIYMNLTGREPGGTVSRAEYVALQQQVVAALQAAVDTNATYTQGATSTPLFDKVYARPLPADLNDPSFGLGTTEFIGQDFGDVYALLKPGYNFDGTQTPVVNRHGDPANSAPVLSLPNFYGAHGYDPEIPEMSAVFFAAGPAIRYGVLSNVHNIDIAPTISKLLSVTPAATVDGTAIPLGSLSLLQDVLAQVKALRATATDRFVQHELDKAISSLGEATDANLWLDDCHLNIRKGNDVFNEARHAAQNLSLLPDEAALQGQINAIVSATRHVTLVAINESTAAPREIARAKELLAKGDAIAGGSGVKAIEFYNGAWRKAVGFGRGFDESSLALD